MKGITNLVRRAGSSSTRNSFSSSAPETDKTDKIDKIAVQLGALQVEALMQGVELNVENAAKGNPDFPLDGVIQVMNQMRQAKNKPVGSRGVHTSRPTSVESRYYADHDLAEDAAKSAGCVSENLLESFANGAVKVEIPSPSISGKDLKVEQSAPSVQAGRSN
jgi:hypothetical protein